MSAQADDSNDSARMVLDMSRGYYKAQLLYVSVKLGLADLLKEGPMTTQQITEHLEGKTQPLALTRFLRELVNQGFFTQTASGELGLNQLSQNLLKPELRDLVLQEVEEGYKVFGELLYSVQTGFPAWERIFGQTLFDYLADQPEAAKRFNTSLIATSQRLAQHLLQYHDFSLVKTIIDLGGGSGVLLSYLLNAHTNLSGVLFELEAGLKDAKEHLNKAGVAQRCQLVKGDFFKNIPTGGDLYLLCQVLHDWEDDAVLIILKNCQKALGQNSRLLIIERLMPPRIEPYNSTITMDLAMLVETGGRERTKDEFSELLSKAGLELTKSVTLTQDFKLLEAKVITDAKISGMI